MVYKKYMYRGGKKFGPYYFKSVRNKEGSVSSIYLGKKNPENNKFKILGVIILIFCAVSLLGYLSYNAFIVSDMPILEDSSEFSGSDNVISESSEEESILDSQPLDNDAAIPTEEGDTNRLPIPEEGGETDEINDISIDNPQEEISKNISDEINETDIDVPLDNTTGTNLSYINSTDIIEIPINVSVNETDEISKLEPDQQIGALISLVFEKGLNKAISLARSINNPAILDEFHDALIDRYYSELIKEKILKNN